MRTAGPTLAALRTLEPAEDFAMNAHVQAPAAVKTTCPYCGVGCGVIATPDGQGGAGIAGDTEHPANFGRLCSKGSALGETLSLDNRLLHPVVDGVRSSWESALGTVAGGLRKVAEQHGPDSIAFYLSGQLLTEDYYVANKLAKGFLGTPHVDTNSRLCMSSAVAAHRRAFGSGHGAGLLRGSRRGRRDRAGRLQHRLVPPDPVPPHGRCPRQARHQARGDRPAPDPDGGGGGPLPRPEAGHRHRPVLRPPGPSREPQVLSTTASFSTTRPASTGPWSAPRSIAPDIAATAAATGLSEADVGQFFTLFARTKRVVTGFSQGVNQSAQGTDKGNAIINCHLATGRIGQPGAGPLSLTGQPNAMGGREVGGLANMLAAHMHFAPEEVDRVRRFWSAPNIITGEGMKAVALFEAVERGKIKALWVMGTNPVVSMPRADAIREAIKGLDLYVVSRGCRRQRHRHGDGPEDRAAAGPGLGREGRHRHQFRAAHLAPAQLPQVSRRGAGGLGDHQRRRQAPRPRRGLRLSERRRDLPRTCLALGLRE